jgi:hypothetical protein
MFRTDTIMRCHLHLIAGTASVLACSQIAGFEEFSGREGSDDTSVEPGNAGGTPSSGSSSGGGPTMTDAGAAGEAQQGGTSAGTGGTGGAAAGSAGTGGTGAPKGCDEQLLLNGDFDGGAVDWQEESSWTGIHGVGDIILQRGDADLVEAGIEPDSGDFLAWFGGVPDTDQGFRINLVQTVTIPTEVTRLVLSGKIRIATLEDPDDRYDQLDIALVESEDVWWSFHVWDNRDAVSSWKPFEVLVTDDTLDILRGRTLIFQVESGTDAEFMTSFWVDSLKLVAECGR